MTAREVVFDGSPPWGFRMNGGTDSGHPLRISRVNPGSKAESQGVREGDMITSINGQPTTSLTNSDSHALLRTVKENLRLGLNENQNGSPRRRSKEIKALAATSEKDIALTPTEKENTKPSRSKLRRQRKRRLKSLLKEKLLGFKETPGHVLTTQPVPEGPQFPTSAIGVKGGAENDDNTSAKFYDNAAIDGSSISNYSVSTTRDAPLVEGSSFVQNASALVSQDSVGDSRSAISDNASGVGKFENTSEPENAPKEVHSGLKSYENVTFAPQEVQHAEIHVWPRKPRMGVENTDYNLIEAVKTVEDEVNAPTSAEPLKSRFCERSETSIEGDFKVPMAETIEFLDSTNLMDALPPTTDAEESVYELIAKDMRTATVSHHEEDGFPYDLNEPVLRIRSPTEIPSCFLPPRRYLDVISEETSDLSDGDRPWENSEKIREINACIDTIPDDWYGPQDGIDTSWRDGKSLEEMSDIPTISDSHSDSELTVDDPKNSFTASQKTDVDAQVKPTRISGANRTEQKGGTSSSENVVVNVVSSFYTSKPVLKPTKIETLFNIDKLHGPNSDVVEIVYLDSSDSEAISSAKSETNLATTPIQEDASDLDRDLRSLKKLPTDMTDDKFKISSPAEEGADDKPSSPSSYQNVDVGHRTPSKLSESIQHSESTHSNSLPNSSNHVSEKPSEQEFAGDEEENQISALISDITESANDLISSSNEHLSSCCGSPQNGSGGRKKISAADIHHRCCSAPLVEGESSPIFKTSRSVCSADMGDEYPNFICDNSDTSSQSTAKRLQSRVISLRELSMTAVLRLPFGISFLKQLGFDQSEYDSYSGYMPEGSEYSFSSKQPMSEGESFVLNDGSDYEDESISNSLPSRPLHYGSHLPPSPPPLGDVKHYEQTQKPLDVRENSKPMKPNEVDLLDLHQKFVLRRGYHEPGEKFLRNKFDRTSNDKEDQDEDFSLEFLALREYHALRQRKMKDAKLAAHNLPRGEEEPKGNSTSATDIGTIECDLNRPSLGSAGDKVAQEEVVDNSRLLELIQSDDFKGSDAELNMSARTSPNRIMLDRSPNSSVGSGSLNIFRNLPAWDKEPTESGMVGSLGLDGENNKANYSKNDAIKVFGSQNDVSRPRQESRDRPKSVPPSGERFRQLMYDEYMNKLAELSQRRKMRAIKLTEPVKSISKPPPNCEDDLRGEFMTRVRERMFKLGLTDDFVLVDNSILADRQIDDRQSEEKKLPKHMQELIDIVDEIGVWSPVNTSDADKKGLSSPSTEEQEGPKREENSEPTPAIWTPRSAGPSPTLGRKFRPVNFQSPTPPRKTSPAQKPKEEPELPKELPAQTTTSSLSSSEIPCRLTSSTSENSTLTSTQLRLPSSQNPTITLLQKAREGQIPKGAQYLDGHHPNDQNSTVIAPGEIVYSVKKQYSKADDEGVKKIVELTPKKFSGIGPTTQDGVPIGLRSEVNENNHQRWYKRMYDSLHKTADHDKDFVTVRYKTRRKDQHPHSSYSGGYASEPERLGYDSDASLSKYATLDRRKIRNKENDFTASTLPRNKYAPSAKHAVNVYKNQPGRIEDYEPGNSSIADIEKKQWWDEVLDIFDGELNNSSKDPYATPSRQSFTTYALRDTGYDSDSTLVFKRRENMSDNLSPAEQKMAYKVIQRGGEVPLHGLRKAIPDRPKEDSEIEYFPLSPTLTRIRVHKKPAKPKEQVFYPVTPEQPVFGAYKRTARSAVIPSPPRRHSSKNSSTLRFYTKISTSKSPDSGSGLSDKTAGSTVSKEAAKTKSPTKRADPSKYAVIRKKEVLRKSPDLKAPAEVKKALKDSTKSSGTVVKSSTTLYSSSLSKAPNEDKSVKVTVAISSKGKDLLTSSSSASSKSDLRKASPHLSPPAKKTSLVSKKLAGSSPTTSPGKIASRPSSRASTVSTNTAPEPSKKFKKENGDSKKKKDRKPEIILRNMDKLKDEDKKKAKKKLETSKKKNVLKKKDKENVPLNPDEISTDEGRLSEIPSKSDGFFQQLLLKDRNTCVPMNIPANAQVQRSPSVSERAKMFDQGYHHALHKSEPSLRNLNVYLCQRKPVSESRFRSLDRGESLSPFYGTLEFFDKLDKFDKHNNVWDPALSYRERALTPTYESIKGRSSSEPPCTSPSPTPDAVDIGSPSVSRSPSCRRIRRSANKTIESVGGVKKKVRSKSLNEADRHSQIDSCSSLSASHAADHADYQSYVLELLHSQPKSERFKELHNFYSSLERMAELEKTTSNTDLRPRLKGEEVIDFDRWKQLRNKERAEIEWSSLYHKLMEDQKHKDLLFNPKETIRWQGDRGLRNKEKSVEDLRQKFQNLANNFDSDSKRDSLSTDVYKPLWRGNSVVNLAQSLTSVVGSKRGRPICETTDAKGELLPKALPPKPNKEIGSRLWSSLSMEQVNALKCQLSEIYNTVSNLKHERIQKIKQNIEDYEMNIAEFGGKGSSLHVRSNSLVGPDQIYSPALKRRYTKKKETLKADSIGSIPSWKSPKPLTEPEKKKLSMSLCAEVKERIKKKKHSSLVIPRETLGAVAAIKGSKKLKSPCQSDSSPRTCYSLMSDDSNDKRSDKRDFLLVLTPMGQQRNEVKKNMDDWGGKEYVKLAMATTSSSSSSASTVIHLGSKDDFKSSDARINEPSQSVGDLKTISPKPRPVSTSPNRTLYSSQSYTDLKELYGEKQATSYATQPLKQCQKSFYDSVDSLTKFTSPDPSKYYRAYLNVVKAGDVRKLREKFESYDDIYNLRKESPVQKRFQSDPDLTRDFLSRKGGDLGKIIVKAQELGDVQCLRKKYEARKPVSPVPLKIEDRYMPHINVISKTAELQQRSLSPQPKNETSRTGNVERLKRQFERRHGATSILGQMYTSTPEIAELRDIAPYLECDWVAHKNVRSPKPTRKTAAARKRPASTSPVRQSILKNADIFANQQFNPEIHRPLYRYQPEPDRSWQPRTWNIRPTVTFKEPIGNPIPTPLRDHASRLHHQDSPHRYVESEVNIHYKSPIRSEAKVAWPEDELAEKQAEIMRRIYQEQRRTKYLNELHDMYSRRHTDNLLPSQKSPIPLNRYDDFPLEQHPPRPRDRTPEPKLVARAMYNFVGQTPRELSFRRGDIIYVRRQIDKHWYEGEHNAMIGLFPFNYVEIIPHDGIRTLPRKANEGQARAKFNFQAQTHLELSLVKGELVLLTRRVDENWFEGRIGNRKGIFPVSYVEVLVEPGERILSPSEPISTKPIVAPASHCVMLNGAKDIGQQHYQPPRPALYSCSSLPPHSKMGDIGMVSQSLHIDTQSDPVPYRVLYNYKPQNDDELELKEGDVVYVMEKCDDGWYVGSLHRNGQFGTFPGNYVDRII